MIEATLHYFGMEDVLCTPTQHVPPTFQSDNERLQWVKQTLGDMIDSLVSTPFFPIASSKSSEGKLTATSSMCIAMSTDNVFPVCGVRIFTCKPRHNNNHGAIP